MNSLGHQLSIYKIENDKVIGFWGEGYLQRFLGSAVGMLA